MYEIRHARESDAEALRDLYLSHLTQNPPAEPKPLGEFAGRLVELSQVPGYHILVGEADGRVVSSVTLVIVKNLTHNLRPYAVIENVVTHADFRGNGYASALMDRAGEIARKHGCYKIMLMTGSKKDSTLGFYENCGYNRNDKTAFIKWL